MRRPPAPLLLLLLLGACDPGPARAGGDTTVQVRSSLAFMQPAPNLDVDGLARHRAGDAAFAAVFVTAPAPNNPGLGPLFNNSSCNGCHVRNGRGLPRFGQDAQLSHLLVRVSLPPGSGEPAVPGGVVPVPGLGAQLQDHAVWGEAPEVRVALAWDEQEGRYPDGTAYRLRAPRLELARPDGSALPAGLLTSLRLPPAVFGLGLLEAVPEPALLSRADPGDRDGDGISGRPNRVWDVALGRTALGRFGLKANSPTLRQQSAEAYLNDVGITTSLFPADDGTTEVGAATLDAAAFYAQSLGVPARQSPEDPEVQHGETLFRQVGCAACHVEALETGASAPPALAHQRFHPYTDLLLHDLGEGLADGRPDFEASGREWRTAPLWGLGLVQTVLPGAGYLHDGRARSPEEAILWHGGEAQRARERFTRLSARERALLLRFLASL